MITVAMRHQPFVVPLTLGMVLFALWLQENDEYKQLFYSCLNTIRESMDFELFSSRMVMASDKCLDDFQAMYANLIEDEDSIDYVTLLEGFKPSYIN